MTSEQKQLYVAIATAIFDILMLVSGFSFATQYREFLMLAAGIVSIIASSFLGMKLNTVVKDQKAAAAFNAAAMQQEEDDLGSY